MADREALETAFLERAGWAGATRAALAGDASGRRYQRLSRGAGRAVLMDAPPERGEETRPFVRIARHLGAIGLSAPGVLAADDQAGFLLLEDLGDDIFARVMEADPAAELPLYMAAAEALAELHRHPPPPGLPQLDAAMLAAMTAPLFDWYATPRPGAAEALGAAVAGLAEPLMAAAPVLVLRDFHAENLIWLPRRSGPARVGLLDFQDALLGHPAYDLVSLLEDARRDTTRELRETVEAHFCALTGADPQDIRYAAALLGAQRNLRILGIFARLAKRDRKPRYIDLMPRVWGHLQGDLAHPALAALRSVVDDHIPAPDPAFTTALRETCRPKP